MSSEINTVEIREMSFSNGDQTIYGKLYIPGTSEKYPTIILSHGYNGAHTDYETECMYFAQHGYVAYVFDFCGGSTRSKSSGQTTDMTIFTEKSDLLTVIDAISSLDFVDDKNLWLFGGSQGGMITVLAAEERAACIRGLILYFPALCIPDDWRKKYPSLADIPETTELWNMRLGRTFFTSIHDFDVYAHLRHFQKDVLIFQGDADEIVPLASAQKTAAHYKNAKLVVFPHEGHGFSEAVNRLSLQQALAFMNQHQSISF